MAAGIGKGARLIDSAARVGTSGNDRRMVVSPAVSFVEMEPRLVLAGWRRRPDTAVTAPVLPGEPELAQWRRDDDDSLLTYTFNPVVKLRALQVSGPSAAIHGEAIAATLPTVSPDDIARALGAGDPRELLRGILTASELEAVEFAGPIGLLAAHREPVVAEAAARVHLALLHAAATMLARTDRVEELAGVLDAICGNALPLLAALPAATPDEILGLQPTEEDCREVLVDEVAGRVAAAYDALWDTEPAIDPGPDRRELRVRACPASLFSSENPFSHSFPGGYRNAAPYLRHGRVWLAWRYCAPGNQSGFAMDGLVHVRGHWVWFPKVYDAVARALRGR
jgi:hypothetical protein